MNNVSKTLTWIEYGPMFSVKKAAAVFNISEGEFWELLYRALTKLNVNTTGILETNGIGVRFTGIAGIIGLKRGMSIEIVPKFLKADTASWREDFLTITLLTEKGKFFHDLPLHARKSNHSNLYVVFAQIWLNLFEARSRNMLRTYIHTSWSSFFLDGEPEEEDIIAPSPDGFLQKGIRLSKSNDANKVLLLAAHQLRTKISIPSLVTRLDSSIAKLKDAVKEPLVRRHKKMNLLRDDTWKDLIELSMIINGGQSLEFSASGFELLPGYMLNTYMAWERLMYIAVKLAFPDYQVAKCTYVFGQREIEQKEHPLRVTPDISLIKDGKTVLLLDAKYKQAQNRRAMISASDIYESLAFLHASECDRILILYPIDDNKIHARSQPGILEIYSNNEKSVIAVFISIAGISMKHGMNKLVEQLRQLISPYLS